MESNTGPEEGGEALAGESPAFLTQDGKWVLEHSLSLQETHGRLGETAAGKDGWRSLRIDHRRGGLGGPPSRTQPPLQPSSQTPVWDPWGQGVLGMSLLN